MDEDSLLERIDERGLRVDTIEGARIQRAVRAGIFDEPLQPTMIGRYEVIRRLGAGGMGVVYVARDAELHREVAVKLVLGTASGGEREQRRLLEEARALARIAHPNVVAIYDVGVHAGRVFMAMELIQGETLRVHCAEHCATWRECMAAYLQAGRGLAATHAAGLVHRDFKPDNALVGVDGRVQILDFGLAHREASTVEPTASDSADAKLQRTRSSTIAGTYRYMAPEHRRGDPVDARSDQFSFCVALWESLHREHPFPEDGREPSGTSSVPAWVRKVLQRGLSSEPSARFPSMDLLLAALADDPVRRQRRRIAVVLGIAAIPAAWGVQMWSVARDREACEREGAAITDVWNDEARRTVEAGILALELSYGPSTWERVEPRLDAYASDWAAMRASTCLAALDGRRQADLAARSSECMLERSDELAALIDELGRADASTIRNAVESADELSDLAPCDDVASLAKRSPPPDDPALREEVAELRRELTRARTLWGTGQAEAARGAAEAVLARAGVIDWPPLRLDALLRAGLYTEGDDPATAVVHYEEAFALAVRLGDDDAATAALASLTSDYGVGLGRVEEARLWLQVAEAFVARADPEEGLPTAHLLNSRASLRSRDGDFTRALADLERALAIREQILGPDDGRTLQVLENVGGVQKQLGDTVSAAKTLERVVEGRTRLLGAEHPEVADALTTLAAIHGAQGRFTEARELLERALAIEERALGTDHPQSVRALRFLGLIYERTGDAAAAVATLERVVAIFERAPATDPLRVGEALLVLAGARGAAYDVPGAVSAAERAKTIIENAVGPNHHEFALALDEPPMRTIGRGIRAGAQRTTTRSRDPRGRSRSRHADTGSAWQELGTSELNAGDADAALAAFRRGLAIALAMDGSIHPNVVFALNNIGLVYRMRDETELSLASFRSASALATFAFEPTHPHVAAAVRNVGELLVDYGEPEAALTELQRAWTMYEARPEAERDDTDLFLSALAEAELALGRLDDAETHARVAVEHAKARGFPRYALAQAQIVLAQVLKAKRENAEARALAKEACTVAHPAHAVRFRRCAALRRK